MPRYQLKNDGTGDKVQILRWTLTTVHSFALIQANTAGWEGGLQGKNFSNITTARKRGHARLIFSLLAQPGSIQIWKKSSEIYQIEQVIMSEKRHREIWKIFSNSSEVSGQKLCFFLVYCHSPVQELPPCLKAQVQHSFPGLTVYSNYQANKGPPCAVMGKGRGIGSRMRGFHFGKCVW